MQGKLRCKFFILPVKKCLPYAARSAALFRGSAVFANKKATRGHMAGRRQAAYLSAKRFALGAKLPLATCPTPRGALRRFALCRLCQQKKPPVWVAFLLAGMAGFEPTNTRVKVWCLTAWRHPYIGLFWKALLLYHAKPRVSSAFQRKRCSFGNNIASTSIILPKIARRYSQNTKK